MKLFCIEYGFLNVVGLNVGEGCVLMFYEVKVMCYLVEYGK